MAPEQAKGEESGPPADFWALGATMVYAVEGEPPFDRGTSIATLAADDHAPPRPRGPGPPMSAAAEGAPPFAPGASIAALAAVVIQPPRDLRRAGALAPL